MIPIYRIEWSDDSCVWGIVPFRSAAVAKQPYVINSAAPLQFEILAPRTRVDALSLEFGTYCRVQSNPLWCELTDSSGQLLACSQVDASKIQDNSFHRVLDLRGITFNVGATYTVRMSAPRVLGAAGDQYVAAYVTREEPQYAEFTRKLISFRRDRRFITRANAPHRPGLALKCILAFPPHASPKALRDALRIASSAFPSQHFDVVELDEATSFWPLVAEADAVVFASGSLDADPDVGFDALCFALHRRGICTIYLASSDFPPDVPEAHFQYRGKLCRVIRDRHNTQRRCHFYLLDYPSVAFYDSITDAPLQTPATQSEITIASLIARIQNVRLPRVAVVSVLHQKSSSIDAFLNHIVRQSYSGEITIVLVDDASPQDDLAKTLLYAERLRLAEPANRRIVTVKNDGNLGNCASRLAGLAAHRADIYVIVDCDCMLNSHFVACHVFEHASPGVDVVIGPLNIESNDRNPADLIAELEYFPNRIPAQAEPQDPIQPDGFLNIVTRNFSIKHRCLATEPLFDIDFSYSRNPGSGFGWEDVEMGYRLYMRGATIRFTAEAFSVHWTHKSSINETDKLAGSMRNFERLFEKHDQMALVARRWAIDTYEKLESWARELHYVGGDVHRRLHARFQSGLNQRPDLISLYRNKQGKPLRILSYRWHVPHQYELYKLPHEFTLVTGWRDAWANYWNYDQRPLRPNARLAPASDIDPSAFDLAILHFDENVLNSTNCNGVIPATWGEPFRWFLALPDLPKIAVCHGTPQFVGQYALDPGPKVTFDVYENERRRLVEALSDARAYVVCNSHQAHREWQFNQSRVIWHGFDPQEFPPATHTKHVLALEPDNHRPHYRGAWEQKAVEQNLDPHLQIETARHKGVAIEHRNTNAFAIPNFRSYVDRIRQFTVYLNTTLRSPMPRARGEAMMTGVIPVCLNNHDVDMFIQPGVNGFYSNETAELADFINFVCRDRGAAERIGAKARQTAIELFNHDRYLSEWDDLIREAVN